MASNKEATVQECEEYIEHHGIHGILKDAIAKLCQERPQNPMKYLRDYFDSLNKVTLFLSSLRCCLFIFFL